MSNINTRTIKDIAVAMPASVRVFEEFKIDYCCGGGRLLDEACRKAGVDVEVITDRIEQLSADARTNAGPEKFESLSSLIWHILSCHHVFTAQELTRLTPLMDKVVRRHGSAHPELVELQAVFADLTASLVPHMRKEEAVLFPYIEKLEAASKNGLAQPVPHFGTVMNPIRMLMTEHDTDGERLARMREITDGYKLPDGACTSFMALYEGIKELEQDLHRHIHLENNLLFPEAAELETRETLSIS